MSDAPRGRWFGPLALDVGCATVRQIGPLRLRVARRVGEWHVSWQHQPDDETADATPQPIEPHPPAPDAAVPPLGDDATVHRFVGAAGRNGSPLALCPAGADRTVVGRPRQPFLLMPGASHSMFLSTALWVQLRLGVDGTLLHEIPTRRPSDTWFGPDTQRGQLAYASRTAARLDPANLPPLVERAITEVRLTNRADDAMMLERIHLPIPTLALFADADDFLWTSTLIAIRHSDRTTVDVTFDDGPPSAARDPRRVAPARQEGESGSLSRMLHRLLG
ncbi:MAG: hypothetical protein AAF772_17385 [Acidobacteriota bacterium]